MKKIFIAIHIMVGDRKATKQIDLQVSQEVYDNLCQYAIENVLDYNQVMNIFPELHDKIHPYIISFSKELGFEDEFGMAYFIRIDCPWQEAIAKYISELKENITKGDTQSMLNYGYYLEHEIYEKEEAIEWYIKALYAGDANALNYILGSAAFQNSKESIVQKVIDWIMNNNIANGMIDEELLDTWTSQEQVSGKISELVDVLKSVKNSLLPIVQVGLEAFYGYGCGYENHESEECIDIEISHEALDTLLTINNVEVTCAEVKSAIDEGHTELSDMHEKISEAFYSMVEEYWLYEADNECERECLEENFERDMNSGIFKPELSEDEFEEKWNNGEIGVGSDVFDYDDTLSADEDNDIVRFQRYQIYLLNSYRDWVYEHDNQFVADRVGCDLRACRDTEVCYTIHLT